MKLCGEVERWPHYEDEGGNEGRLVTKRSRSARKIDDDLCSLVKRSAGLFFSGI